MIVNKMTKAELVDLFTKFDAQLVERTAELKVARQENEQLRALNAEWAGEAQRLKVALLRSQGRSSVNREERTAEKPTSALQQASIEYCRAKGVTSVTVAQLKAAGYIG